MRLIGCIRAAFTPGRSLLRRVLLANATLAIALFALITAIHLTTSKEAFRRQVELRAKSLASFVSAEAPYPLLVGDREQLLRIAQSALADEDVLSVSVSDSAGRVAAVVRRPGIKPLDKISSVTVRTALVTPVNDPLFDGDKPSDRTALGSVEVRLSRESEQILFARTIFRALSAATLALVFILAIQFVHFKRLLRPLETLAAFTQHVGRGNLALRAPVVRRDEIGELALSFNNMVDRLSETTVSRDYVDNIVRSMGDALLVTGNDLRIQTANGAAAHLLGMEEDELRG
jgi:nitrogen fixation/metabolism regulation signal transduction histidine kinase